MADFDTGDVVRVGMVQSIPNSGEIVNVATVQITSGGGLAFAAAAADIAEWCDDLWATVEALITDDQVADHISIKNMTQSTVWGNIAWTTYTGGGSVNDPVASQVALMGWGRTPISRVQIRKYIGVFTENNMTVGLWDSTVRAAALNFMDYVVTGHTMTNGLVLRGCAYRLSDGRVTFATSGATSAQPVIQRRRRAGRGS